LIFASDQFYLNVAHASIARSWQMQEGPAEGNWKFAAIESVGAFRAYSYVYFCLRTSKAFNLGDFDNC